MAPPRVFPFRYGLFRPLLSLLGMGPRFSSVRLDDERLRVRMGVWFSADVPRRSIRSATPYKGFVGGIGVHGGRGRWLVNGAAKGLVTLEIDPPGRGHVMGAPVKLRALRISMKSPEELIAALTDGGVPRKD